jgi:hypothetical protein
VSILFDGEIDVHYRVRIGSGGLNPTSAVTSTVRPFRTKFTSPPPGAGCSQEEEVRTSRQDRGSGRKAEPDVQHHPGRTRSSRPDNDGHRGRLTDHATREARPPGVSRRSDRLRGAAEGLRSDREAVAAPIRANVAAIAQPCLASHLKVTCRSRELEDSRSGLPGHSRRAGNQRLSSEVNCLSASCWPIVQCSWPIGDCPLRAGIAPECRVRLLV